MGKLGNKMAVLLGDAEHVVKECDDDTWVDDVFLIELASNAMLHMRQQYDSSKGHVLNIVTSGNTARDKEALDEDDVYDTESFYFTGEDCEDLALFFKFAAKCLREGKNVKKEGNL